MSEGGMDLVVGFCLGIIMWAIGWKALKLYLLSRKTPDLSWINRLKLSIRGRVYLERRRLENWGGYLPFYLVLCPTHGPFEDYPHGNDEYFSCPRCYAEMLEKHEKADSQ